MSHRIIRASPSSLSLSSRTHLVHGSTSCATREPHARVRTDGRTDGRDRSSTIARDVSQPPHRRRASFSSSFFARTLARLSRALGVIVAMTLTLSVRSSLSLSFRAINTEFGARSATVDRHDQPSSRTDPPASWPFLANQRPAIPFDPDCNVFRNRCATSPSATTLPSPTLGSVPLGGRGVIRRLPSRSDWRLIARLSLTDENLRGVTGRNHDRPARHADALRSTLRLQIFPPCYVDRRANLKRTRV